MKKILFVLLALMFFSARVEAGAIYGTPFTGSIGGTGGQMYLGVSNFDVNHLPNFIKAIGFLTDPNSPTDAIVNCIGDSTEAGVNDVGNATSVYTNGRVQSTCAQMAQMFTVNGIPANMDNWFGDAGATTHSSTLPNYYPYVTEGSGWAPSSGANNAPGGLMENNSTTTNPLTTVTNTQEDTATIFYLQKSGFGTFTWSVDGGSTTSVNENGATTAIMTTTFSMGSPGIHSLAIARTSGNIFIVGVDFSNSKQHRVRFRNLGIGGSTTAQWVATGNNWYTGVAMAQPVFASSLTFVNLGINDWIQNGSNTPSGSVANLNTLYSNIETASGNTTDIVVIDPIPSSTSAVSASIQSSYTSAIVSNALNNNYLMLDQNARFGNYTQAVAAGNMGSGDPYHPTYEGYRNLAAFRTQVLITQISAGQLASPSNTNATLTPGTNVASCTCSSATCSNLRGTLSISGGTATTGTICSLSWSATPYAYICSATMNGGSTAFGVGNSLATTTGVNITAASSILGSNLSVNYSCQP